MLHHIPFAQAVDFQQAGGKAANLARALSLGFQIPEGFVLPRSVLGLFLESNHFLPRVQKTLDAYEKTEWRERLARFEDLRAAALKLPIPATVQAEVEPVFLQLLQRSPAGVAVRSSGVCEDLEKASFAGIYETFLGVNSVNAFWQSVIRCWCSAWSPQAAAYAHKLGIAIPLDGMAVIGQTLIPAESAGVVFTADQATGNPWRFVINATFGLAADLVDGSAPADRFVLAWDTGEILEKRVEIKPNRLMFQANRVEAIPIPDQQQPLPSLSDEQARAIGRMALAVDRAFDRRMDLEWAIANGQLYLLQARPLTALPDFFPHELSVEEAAETWTPYLNEHGTMNERERQIAPCHRHRWLLELWNYFLTADDVFPHRSGRERDFNGYRYTTEWKWQASPPDWPRIESWLERHEPRLRNDWTAQLERVRQANAWLDTQMAVTLNNPDARAVDWLCLALAYEREEYQMQAAVWYAPQWLIFTCEELLRRFVVETMPGAGIPGLPAGLLQGLHGYSVERTMSAQALGRSAQEE
ncbi:MAG: hypothetical protein EHM21_15150, partial [Chloroflexi bacterium]